MSSQRSDRAADAVWRRLCDGLNDPWLDDIRTLRTAEDDFESTLDIWTVALTVELKQPERRDTAAMILSRMSELAQAAEQDTAAD